MTVMVSIDLDSFPQGMDCFYEPLKPGFYTLSETSSLFAVV